MTKAGIKTEDYREINKYWFKRLVYDYKRVFKYCTGFNWDDNLYREEGIDHIIQKRSNMLGFNPYEYNIMTWGYPSSSDTERILKLKHKGVEIRAGNPEWGAEPDKLYFVIKHGERLT